MEKSEVTNQLNLVGDTYKLLENSFCRTLIKQSTRNVNMKTRRDESSVYQLMKNQLFKSADCLKRQGIETKRPCRCGIAHYLLGKLRIKELYYYSFDKDTDGKNLELIQMNTDGFYLGLSIEIHDHFGKSDKNV